MGEMTESKAYPMPSKGVNWVRIENADNGFIVNWGEKESKPNGSMDHCEYIDRSQVFSLEEKDNAWSKFRELKEAEWAYEAQQKGK